MTWHRVVLLYEDQYGRIPNFGLHKLVCSLVVDALGSAALDLDRRLLDGRPMKGRDKVLRACRRDLSKLSPDGAPVIAVLDRDRVHEAVGLPRGSSDTELRAALLRDCDATGHLHFVFIVDNTESVLEAALRCDATLNNEWVTRATVYKEAQYRDMVLAEIASVRKVGVREALIKELPCLLELRELVVRALRG